MAGSGREDRRRGRLSARGLVLLAAAGLLAGCGNFWQNPYGTSSNNNSNGTATTTTLTPSLTSVAVGGSVTLTATVSPSAATGTVTFYSGSTSLDTQTLSSGTATSTQSFSTAGTESLTATYSGDSTYASSSGTASVTVTAAAAGAALANRAAAMSVFGGGVVSNASRDVSTSAFAAAPIHAMEPFSAKDATLAAKNAEAVVVENGGAVTMTGATLRAAAGNGRGVFLFRSPAKTNGKPETDSEPSFAATGGSIAYTCDAEATKACAEGSTARGQNAPATLFAVTNAKATIALSDVEITNDTATATSRFGTLLTAAAVGPWGTTGQNGGHATFRAEGTKLTGDVIVDGISTAALSLLEDKSGTGSSLKGAIDEADTGKTVSLTLDAESLWMVTGTSYLTSLDGLDLSGTTVNNIEGGGHCVYYSDEINGASSQAVYALSGGGYLAPKGTTGLACE